MRRTLLRDVLCHRGLLLPRQLHVDRGAAQRRGRRHGGARVPAHRGIPQLGGLLLGQVLAARRTSAASAQLLADRGGRNPWRRRRVATHERQQRVDIVAHMRVLSVRGASVRDQRGAAACDSDGEHFLGAGAV